MHRVEQPRSARKQTECTDAFSLYSLA